jgi:hypothetical protein
MDGKSARRRTARGKKFIILYTKDFKNYFIKKIKIFDEFIFNSLFFIILNQRIIIIIIMT